MCRVKINTRAVPLSSRSFRLHLAPFFPRAPIFLAAHIRVKFFDKRPGALSVSVPPLAFFAEARFAPRTAHRHLFSAVARFSSDTSFLVRLASRFTIFCPEAPCRAILSLPCCRSLRPWISQPPLRNFYSRPLWNSRILGHFRF